MFLIWGSHTGPSEDQSGRTRRYPQRSTQITDYTKGDNTKIDIEGEKKQTRAPSEWPTYLLNLLSAVACSSVITRWITLHNLQTLLAPLPGLLPEAPRLWLRCLSCFDVPTLGLNLTRGDTRLKWDGGKKNVYRCKTACSCEVSSLLGNFQQISVISFCLSIRNKPWTGTEKLKGQKEMVW